MSSKTILISLCAVIIIGGALYVAISQKSSTNNNVAIETPPVQTQAEVPAQKEETVVTAPKADASTDVIIDYLVDGQTSNETKTVQATLDASIPSTTQDSTINTNF